MEIGVDEEDGTREGDRSPDSVSLSGGASVPWPADLAAAGERGTRAEGRKQGRKAAPKGDANAGAGDRDRQRDCNSGNRGTGATARPRERSRGARVGEPRERRSRGKRQEGSIAREIRLFG